LQQAIAQPQDNKAKFAHIPMRMHHSVDLHQPAVSRGSCQVSAAKTGASVFSFDHVHFLVPLTARLQTIKNRLGIIQFRDGIFSKTRGTTLVDVSFIALDDPCIRSSYVTGTPSSSTAAMSRFEPSARECSSASYLQTVLAVFDTESLLKHRRFTLSVRAFAIYNLQSCKYWHYCSGYSAGCQGKFSTGLYQLEPCHSI
jgi:hypothetical protein